jgi:hypothetical protein
MRSCITMTALASLLLAADESRPGPKDAPAPPGWSFATEGSGIPRNQDAGSFAVAVDRAVVHGGQAAVSIRSIVEEPKSFRAVTQFIKADAYRGKRVRLAGYLKTRDVRGRGALWLRVDGPDAKLIALESMADRGVTGTSDWSRHEVVLDVPEAAVRLAFGALLVDTGQVWADDLTLEVVDPKEVKVTAQPMTTAARTANLDFEAAGAGDTDPIPGWDVYGINNGSYSRRIVEGRAHGGRASLEIKSAPEAEATASEFSINQHLAAGPYRGKRVRFRAYLKTEGLAKPALLWMSSFSDSETRFVTTMGRGPKGTTDWRPHEVVLDVSDEAESLNFGVVLDGAGTLGVDDASLEVVDPAKIPATEGVKVVRRDPAQRARELEETLPRTPDRPANLDFER